MALNIVEFYLLALLALLVFKTCHVLALQNRLEYKS